MAIGSKHGKLFLDFTWRGIRCKEYVGWKDNAANRKELKRRHRLLRAQIENGTFEYRDWFPEGRRIKEFYPEENADLTVGEYLERWHRERSPFRTDGTLIEGADLHPTSWYRYGRNIRSRLVPALGHVKLTELKRTQIREYRRSLEAESLSGPYIAGIISVLGTALRYAAEEELIDQSPMPTFGRTISKRRIGAAKPLAPDEISRFLAALPEVGKLPRGRRVDGATLRDLYTAWFRIGWRPNEVVALRFEGLHFETQKVEIRRGRYKLFGGGEATPKTGMRVVDCSYDPEIFACFSRRRDAQRGEGYVFADTAGEPLDQEQLAVSIWTPTLERSGLEHRGQYNIKHTFITLAVSAGEDPGWIARVCGTSEKMIWGHYRSWFPGDGTRHGGRVAARLLESVPKRGPEEFGPPGNVEQENEDADIEVRS